MMVPGGAAHKVVMVTFTLACGSLSLLGHLPHTHLLVIGLMKAYGQHSSDLHLQAHEPT